MARKACDYCGIEYDDHLQRCPICGSVNENADGIYEGEDADEELLTPPPRKNPDPRPARADGAPRRPRTYVAQPEDDEEDVKPRSGRRRGAREAPKEDMIPKWMSVLICIFLGLAVLIGAVFALYSMGILTPKEKPKQEDTSLTLPLEEKPKPQTEVPDPAPETTAVKCTGLTLEPMELTADVKDKLVLITAKCSPENCGETVLWSSEDESVSVVDQNGTVRAVGEGTTQIVATCGSVTASCTVRNTFAAVEPPPAAASASLNLADFTLRKAGETAKITVKDAPAGASAVWSIGDSSVATIAQDGTVTGVKSGTTTATCEVGGQKLKCIVRCIISGTAPPTSSNAEVVGDYKLDHDDVTLDKGESFEISVVGTTSGGWSVSDGTVCTVDAKGIVTATGSGTATVFTTVGGQKLQCVVRVK